MSSCSPLRLRAPLERAGLLIVLAALSACDIPTEVPAFDVRWVFSVLGYTIAVDQLLPATGVTIADGNFLVGTDTVILNETLGSLCPACIASVPPLPKPLFSQVFNQTGNLATDVVSVQLVSGSISLAIQNNLGFDPIRPAAAAPGTMVIALYDVNAGGRVLVLDTLDGSVLTDSVPNGALTTVLLNLVPGTVSSTIYVEVDLFSPAGDPVPSDLTATLDITLVVGPVSVSSATLDVDGRAVTLDPTGLGVEDIDSDVTERILSGAIILAIENPFGVGVDVVFDISGPGFTTLQRALNISSAPTSTVTVSYTGAEFRKFLGQPGVQASGNGTVSAPGGPVTVTPTQELVVEADLDLTVTIGGGDSSCLTCL